MSQKLMNTEILDKYLADSCRGVELDPLGTHVTWFHMPHNDGDGVRFMALAKVKGTDDPAEVKGTMPWEVWDKLPEAIVTEDD